MLAFTAVTRVALGGPIKSARLLVPELVPGCEEAWQVPVAQQDRAQDS